VINADTPPVFTAARFEGHVEGATLQLSMRLGDSTIAQDFTLRRDRRVKIIRCF